MAELALPHPSPGAPAAGADPGAHPGDLPAALRPWLGDEPFLDGTAEARFGPRVARREQLGRAQEHAHRLLERFLWGTDPSGRILLPGSRSEAFWLERPPEMDALARLAEGGPAAPLLAATRKALAAPDPPPGPRRIAAVLAAFHRDLREAAPGLPGLVPGELRPAGPFDPARADTPERRAVLDAGRLLGSRSDLFDAVLVHGSLATLDERPGVSDLDLLVVLTGDAAESAEGLLAAREATLSLWPILQRVDPLQHHGTFAVTPADLAFYPQVFLPLAVTREARVLAGPPEGFPVVLRPTGLARRLVLLRAAEMLRRELPDSLFLAKLHLQVVLLAPCFLLQARGGFLYKRDAFGPFAGIAPAGAARAVAAASRARAENLYGAGLADLPAIRERVADEGLSPLLEAAVLQRHLLRPLPPALRDLLEPAAVADRAALADLLEASCPPPGDDLADDEFSQAPAAAAPHPGLPSRAHVAERGVRREGGPDSPPAAPGAPVPVAAAAGGKAPAVRRSPAPPAPVPGAPPAPGDSAVRWRETARRYVRALGAEEAVLAAWGIGTPDPGSDLDLVLVVDRARAREVDWTRCRAVLEEMPPADRELLEHPPSAILPADLASRAGLLSPLFQCTPLLGDPPPPEWWRVPGPDHALALAADYVLAMYPGEMLRLETTLRGGGDEAPSPAAVARRVGALRHTLALVRLAGLEPPAALEALARRARDLRRDPAAPGAEDEIRRLPGEAILPLAQLATLLAAELRRRGFPAAPAGLPRVRGTLGERIVLVEGASPRDIATLARALEDTAPGRFLTNVAPLPLAWGLLDARGRHGILEELYGSAPFRAPETGMPPPPTAFRERWDAVAAHFSFLAEVRCPFGWFFPNHFLVDPGPFLEGDAP